jgi:hypothetical protein
MMPVGGAISRAAPPPTMDWHAIRFGHLEIIIDTRSKCPSSLRIDGHGGVVKSKRLSEV